MTDVIARGFFVTLKTGAYMVATLDAGTYIVSKLLSVPSRPVQSSIVIGSACFLMVIFLHFIFDANIRDSLQKVQRDMKMASLSTGRRVGFLHPDWGVVGSRWGGGYLQMLRLVLIIEVGTAVLTLPKHGGPPLALLLSGVGFAITVLLTFYNLKNSNDSLQ